MYGVKLSTPGREKNEHRTEAQMTPKTIQADAKREPLSRARILQAAMEVADAEGLDALSMRRIASELDASPMALYNHVPNKDALLEGLSGQLLLEIDLSVLDSADPPAALRQGYGEFRRVLLRHPNLIPVIERNVVVSVDAMRPIELALSLLQRLGFSPDEALFAHWALTGFTIGHVVWQISSPLFQGGEIAGHALEHKRMLPVEQFPCLHQALPWLEKCDMDGAFEFGIDCLIKGFEARLAEGAS
jgi:TetR/AcrR family tetracycline transcriptional repressor